MSGGSYDYLYAKVEDGLFTGDYTDGLYHLERMAERLEGLDWCSEIGRDVRALIKRAQQIDAELTRFRDVFHAVEWWDSGDWTESDVREAVAKYRGEGGEDSTDG